VADERDSRVDELFDQLMERARAYEPNEMVPGQPTAVGFTSTLVREIAELKERVERLEQGSD